MPAKDAALPQPLHTQLETAICGQKSCMCTLSCLGGPAACCCSHSAFVAWPSRPLQHAEFQLLFKALSILQVLHEHFQSSPARTEDPEQAQLFMIPVYLGRYYNWFWQQWSTPGRLLLPSPTEGIPVPGVLHRRAPQDAPAACLYGATTGPMPSLGSHRHLYEGLPMRSSGLRVRLAGLQAVRGRLSGTARPGMRLAAPSAGGRSGCGPRG